MKRWRLWRDPLFWATLFVVFYLAAHVLSLFMNPDRYTYVDQLPAWGEAP